jgi:hypothetical protein
LVQDAHHEDLIHHGFDVEHRHDLKNHHVRVDLHDVAANLDPKAFWAHHLMDDAHQSELDAPLALNCLLVVKVLMGDHFFLPSYFLLHALKFYEHFYN